MEQDQKGFLVDHNEKGIQFTIGFVVEKVRGRRWYLLSIVVEGCAIFYGWVGDMEGACVREKLKEHLNLKASSNNFKQLMTGFDKRQG
jgi:hypothetical protein